MSMNVHAKVLSMNVGGMYPGHAQAQELTDKSQQKNQESQSLVGTRCCPCVTIAFCPSVALIRKVLVSQSVC